MKSFFISFELPSNVFSAVLGRNGSVKSSLADEHNLRIDFENENGDHFVCRLEGEEENCLKVQEILQRIAETQVKMNINDD